MFEAKGEDEFDRGLERALGPVVSEAGPSTGPSQSEIFHDRWDLTKELMRTPDAHRWKRRLDSIARLIEANSVCAAIAIKDGSFLIATNYDLTAESDTEGLRLIETVMNFFKKVSESGVINDSEGYKKAFYETFKAICLGAMGGLQIPAATKARLSDDDFLESVVARRAVLDGLQGKQRQKKLRTFRDYISEHSEIGHYPADQAAAYYVCTALLLDFEKVIKFIDQYKDLSDISAEANFITAIKGYTKDNVITREKLTGKISATGERGGIITHAEMKILALMEDTLRKTVEQRSTYIGISKLCCLDCHAMVHAVNTAYGHPIQMRGAHNVRHSEHWTPPFNLSKDFHENIGRQLLFPDRPKTRGNLRPEAPEDDFQEKVKQKFRIAYEQSKRSLPNGNIELGARGVVQYSSFSDSGGSPGQSRQDSESGRDLSKLHKKYLEHWQSTVKLRESLSAGPISSEEKSMIELGLKLHDYQSFTDLFDIELTFDTDAAARQFAAIVALLSNEEPSATQKGQLFNFLKSSIYCGKHLADCFANLEQNVLALAPSNLTPTSEPSPKRPKASS